MLRLTYPARRQPTAPATVELTQPEIAAVVVTKKFRGVRRGDTPPTASVVQWLAEIGGYSGKSSGGSPYVLTTLHSRGITPEFRCGGNRPQIWATAY